MKRATNKNWKEETQLHEITPSPRVWSNLEKSLTHSNAVSKRQKYWSAAAILIFLCGTAFFVENQLSDSSGISNTEFVESSKQEIKTGNASDPKSENMLVQQEEGDKDKNELIQEAFQKRELPTETPIKDQLVSNDTQNKKSVRSEKLLATPQKNSAVEIILASNPHNTETNSLASSEKNDEQTLAIQNHTENIQLAQHEETSSDEPSEILAMDEGANDKDENTSEEKTPDVNEIIVLDDNPTKKDNQQKGIGEDHVENEYWTYHDGSGEENDNLWMISGNTQIPKGKDQANGSTLKTGYESHFNTLDATLSSSQRSYDYTSRNESEISFVRKVYGGLSLTAGVNYFLENGTHSQQNRVFDGFLSTENHQEIGKYHFEQISIPIGVRYTYAYKSKLNSYIQSSYSFAAKRNFSQDLVKKDLEERFSREYLSVGLGLEYKLTSWMGLFAQPSYKIGMNVSDDSYFGLKTGLNFHL
jgi:hypothetical protein